MRNILTITLALTLGCATVFGGGGTATIKPTPQSLPAAFVNEFNDHLAQLNDLESEFTGLAAILDAGVFIVEPPLAIPSEPDSHWTLSLFTLPLEVITSSKNTWMADWLKTNFIIPIRQSALISVNDYRETGLSENAAAQPTKQTLNSHLQNLIIAATVAATIGNSMVYPQKFADMLQGLINRLPDGPRKTELAKVHQQAATTARTFKGPWLNASRTTKDWLWDNSRALAKKLYALASSYQATLRANKLLDNAFKLPAMTQPIDLNAINMAHRMEEAGL